MCDHVPMDTANLDRVARRYRDAEAALDAARAELQTEAVDFLRQNDERGAVTTVVRITGWSREHLRRLREKAELEALRQQVAELGAAKKPSPAAAPRQQVTQTLRKPVPSISPKVLALPLDRIAWLVDKAETTSPEWVEGIRQEYPHLQGPDLDYLIVDLGHQKGFKIPELDEPSATDEATDEERPMTSEEQTA